MWLIWIFICSFSVSSLFEYRTALTATLPDLFVLVPLVLEGSLVHNRCSVDICWVNEQTCALQCIYKAPSTVSPLKRLQQFFNENRTLPFYNAGPILQMRQWGPGRLCAFPEVTWLVYAGVVGTPSWILTADPSPTQQVSSSPLPSGPTPRRLSVSPSIGGETGLLSCMLPEELLVQILAERLQVRPRPPAQSCRAHTRPSRYERRLSHRSPTAA